MKWLNDLVGKLLLGLGLDIETPIGASLQFFIYDVIKITLLLCVLIFFISYIQSYFSPERSRKILGRFKELGPNTLSALLGTVTPFCSFSSIPLFIGFASAGLPMSSTFSFLISSPMVDLGSLVLLMSIFGGKVAILYVVFGLLIAILGGTVLGRLKMEDQVEDFIHKARMAETESPNLSFKDRVDFSKEQVVDTFKQVFPYILAGVGIGAFIHNWTPQSWIENLLGSGNPFGVIIVTFVGIPMYPDIFGTHTHCRSSFGQGSSTRDCPSLYDGSHHPELTLSNHAKEAIEAKITWSIYHNLYNRHYSRRLCL